MPLHGESHAHCDRRMGACAYQSAVVFACCRAYSILSQAQMEMLESSGQYHVSWRHSLSGLDLARLCPTFQHRTRHIDLSDVCCTLLSLRQKLLRKRTM